MMKRTLKRALGLTLIFAISAACFAALATAEDHWASGYIARAQEKGWLAQAGIDPAFPPDGGITYESLIIMVCEAMGIKPGYSLSSSIEAVNDWDLEEPKDAYLVFQDAQNAAVNQMGYLKIATQFGLLTLSDYESVEGSYIKMEVDSLPERKLCPYRPALRSDAVMLITRGLGLLNPAKHYVVGSKPFSDWETVPYWQKGCLRVLVNAGVLSGGENCAARVEDPISLGELCEMLCRAFDFMTEGIDYTIGVEYSLWSGQHMLAHLPVPVQVIQGLIYVPVRSIYQTGIDLYAERTEPYRLNVGYWNKDKQSIRFAKRYSVNYFAGRVNYEVAAAPMRLLFGEVMLPIMTVDDKRFYDSVVHFEITEDYLPMIETVLDFSRVSANEVEAEDCRWPRSSLFVFSGDFTMECWVYPNGESSSFSRMGIMMSSTADGEHSFGLGVNQNGELSFEGEFSESGKIQLVSGAGEVPVGKWSHIAAVRSDDNLTLYVNGKMVAETVVSGDRVIHGEGDFYIGRAGNVGNGNSEAADPATFYGYIEAQNFFEYAKYTKDFSWVIAPSLYQKNKK